MIYIVFMAMLCAWNLNAQNYNVVLAANPANGGIISGTGTYEHGAKIVVEATPNTYFEFTGWEEDGTLISTEPVLTFIVTDNRMLVANFGIPTTPFEITVSTKPEKSGTVSGDGFFTFGTIVTVTAVANPKFQFLNWTENGIIVSTEAEYSFPIYEPRNLVANFVIE